jgi:serine/threonine-protein kinase
MTQNPNNSSAGSMDTELGRLVVEQRLATPEEVEQCIQLRSTNSESLADLLIEQGVVTQRQIARVKSSIEESRRGQQIPGYVIKGRLGAGAMATVFKAQQVSLDRMVAIKVLPRKMSESADYVQRFYQEGKAAAKLNHPNIVQAFDVGEAGGYHYFVMEYVEGHTLFDELAAHKVFGESEALRIVIQVARALQHAHSMGLIHRDVKPKNIMLTPEGTAKLADMGLARMTSDAEAAQAEAGRAFGTPYYISPEQIRGEVDIDARADIYSLGATLYHMVTGQVPFEGPTPAAVMHKHLKEQLVPPDHLNTELSAGVGEVVEVMMAKDRNRRYASAQDLLVDLEAIAKGEPPLQARAQIDANVLSGLAMGRPDETVELPTPIEQASGYPTAMWVLGAALAASLLLNAVLLIAFASG